MEDVYTRSPVWEELVSKNWHWTLFKSVFLEVALFGFLKET